MDCKNKIIIFDTNIILQDPKLLENVISKENNKKLLIPLTVLMELDKLKYDRNLGYIARKSIRTLMQIYKKYKAKIIFDTEEVEKILQSIIQIDENETLAVPNAAKQFLLKEINNDFKIIATAKKFNACLITKDISMALIAESQGVKTELLTNIDDVEYCPYIEMQTESALTTIFKDSKKPFDTVYSYDTDVYINVLKHFGRKNEWFFIILRNDNNEVDCIYAHNPLEEKLELINTGKLKKDYTKIKTDKYEIKAKDEYQICAIYALKNAPASLILGKYGSGKSLLATAYALSIVEDKKVFISRPNIGLDSRYDIGYLPGDKNEKLIEWLSGFLSAMYYLYGNTRGQQVNNVSYDFVKDELFFKKFEIIPLNMLQGASILENDIFVVDEVQLVNISYMTMILSRMNNDSKLIMLGDYKQTYDVIKPSESGILKLLKLFKLSENELKELNINPEVKKHLAVVKLKNYYRSPLTEIADGINQAF